MRLKINLRGIQFQLKIKDYVVSKDECLDCQYCTVDYFFSSGDWLNYSRGNTNTLLSCEVEALIYKIELYRAK